jgi:hypothetical protein
VGTYVPADVAGTEGSQKAAKYSGSVPWIKYSALASNTLTATGVTGFGDFTGISSASPTVTIVADPGLTVCQNSSLTLTANPTGGDPELTYAWLPNGETTQSITPSTASAGSTEYTVTVTDGNGIEATSSATVIVNTPSFVPAVRHVHDLTATGENIKWYAASSGGTALASDDVLPAGTHHYFASQTVNSVESSARFDVTVTIDPTPCAPSGAATQSGTTVADLVATGGTGSTIRWYNVATGGTALASSTALQAGTYYATQTIDCTESATRLAVTVTVIE